MELPVPNLAAAIAPSSGLSLRSSWARSLGHRLGRSDVVDDVREAPAHEAGNANFESTIVPGELREEYPGAG